MIVLIMDLDWMFDKCETPNVNCMKLSSFHKQRGDTVYFVDDMSELTMQYDKLYIFANSDSVPTPGGKIINDSRTTLFGDRFELCGAKTLGPVIMGCRPDYLLYNVTNEKSNSYTKANFVTFYTDCGDAIPIRQEWKNTKKGVKRTIVTDTLLWEQQPRDIVKCLKELYNEKNVVFLNPISLATLVHNEEVRSAFFHLKFSRGTLFKWRNDVGQDEEAAQRICKFLKELRQHTHSTVGRVPFKAVCGDWSFDLERLLRVFAVFKQNECKCFLPPIKQPGHPIYTWLYKWCEIAFEDSFIEEMLFFKYAQKGQRWFHIINDRSNWGEARTKFLIQLLAQDKWQELLPQMSIKWGGLSIDPSLIDFEQIQKYGKMLV